MAADRLGLKWHRSAGGACNEKVDAPKLCPYTDRIRPATEVAFREQTLGSSVAQLRSAIAELQLNRKAVALETAKRSPLYRGRLDHIDATRVDDPADGAKLRF